METDKLFEALKKKAINAEQAKINRAIGILKSAICKDPNGSSFNFRSTVISISGTSDRKAAEVKPDDFFRALSDYILNYREDMLVSDEVSRFMDAQRRYAEQVNSMQQYLTEENQ